MMTPQGLPKEVPAGGHPVRQPRPHRHAGLDPAGANGLQRRDADEPGGGRRPRRLPRPVCPFWPVRGSVSCNLAGGWQRTKATGIDEGGEKNTPAAWCILWRLVKSLPALHTQASSFLLHPTKLLPDMEVQRSRPRAKVQSLCRSQVFLAG